MSDIKISPVGSEIIDGLVAGDRILTYKGYGVKRLYMAIFQDGDIIINNFRVNIYSNRFEFPVIGKSLPCIFNVRAISTMPTLKRTSIMVEEYGAIPDPDYFNIIDLDEDGLPIYADAVSAANSIQLYKKPIVNGNSLGERVLLKTVDNTAENRLLYKIQEPIEIAEP